MGVRSPSGLSVLDRKRVAVVVNLPAGVRVFRGVGTYDCDRVLGNVLRVELDQPAQLDGDPVFVFHEGSWNGELAQDKEHGCDYALTIDAAKVTDRPVCNEGQS